MLYNNLKGYKKSLIMKEFTTEEEALFGRFISEIFNDGLLYTYSEKAYLEIFKNKLKKDVDSKEIRNIIKKTLELVE